MNFSNTAVAGRAPTLAIFIAAVALGFEPPVAQAQSNTKSMGNHLSGNPPGTVTQKDDDRSSRVSPTERIHRDGPPPRSKHNVERPIDGYGNNPEQLEMNMSHTMLRRLLPSDYADVYGEMAGQSRRSPREISNYVFAQTINRSNPFGASDFVWQWGQFLDHDMDLTGGIDPPESAPIAIPPDDLHFDPAIAMALNRSIYQVDADSIRQQINEITGWIDASNVYGSDDARSAALRTLDGTGRLKTGVDDLLPNNDDGLTNAGGPDSTLFLAGDVRVNEQVALTAIHTLFMREHNRWADILRAENPRASGDEIFNHARALVAAEMQHITYTEFLPVLLGPNALSEYRGYSRRTDARIMNEFSTAAFRLGHSLLSPVLLRLDENGQTIAAGNISLSDAFFAPDQIRQHGIEPLLRGLSRQVCQDMDSFVIDDVRNFLFGAPGSGGFDLVSLNIQRGRDHGLASYNDARRALGLTPASRFEDISSDPEVANRLWQAYDSVEDVDLWVGGVAEDNYRKSMLGELFHTLVRAQFESLRDGDRFWYAYALNRKDLNRVSRLSLADIIRLNTDIDDEIQDNVFRARARRR